MIYSAKLEYFAELATWKLTILRGGRCFLGSTRQEAIHNAMGCLHKGNTLRITQ
jgi:hypothetical protein